MARQPYRAADPPPPTRYGGQTHLDPVALWVAGFIVLCALIRLGVCIRRHDFDEDALLACATVSVTVWLTVGATRNRRRRGS